MTARLVRWVGQQSVMRVLAAIAEEAGLDEKTVRSVFHEYVARLEADTRFETPRWLSNKHELGRRHDRHGARGCNSQPMRSGIVREPVASPGARHRRRDMASSLGRETSVSSYRS